MTAPIFILAGEASGDQLAAHLMGAVNNAYEKTDWIGVGGRLMQAKGLYLWWIWKRYRSWDLAEL